MCVLPLSALQRGVSVVRLGGPDPGVLFGKQDSSDWWTGTRRVQVHHHQLPSLTWHSMWTCPLTRRPGQERPQAAAAVLDPLGVQWKTPASLRDDTLVRLHVLRKQGSTLAQSTQAPLPPGLECSWVTQRNHCSWLKSAE